MKKAVKIVIIVLMLAFLIVLDLVVVKFLGTKEKPLVNEYKETLNFVADNVNNEIVQEVKVEEKKIEEPSSAKATEGEAKFKMPEACDLEVPFTCQSPYQNWNMPWQEACEEAALIMIDHYLKERESGYQGIRLSGTEIPKDLANQEILDMVDWQLANWGGHFDLKAEDIAKLAKEYYGYKNVEVKYDITIDDIKKEVAQGNPVLVPTAGQLLDNPHFTAAGPAYHNLVVVGFDENGFITNDPGIWQGFKFRYTFDNLYNSIHDFVDGTSKSNPYPILEGRKAKVVIKK